MEKIVANIGLHAKEVRTSISDLEAATFLQEAFEISYNRARALVNMIHNHREATGEKTMPMTLTYRQYARFSAFRYTKNKVKTWVYPHVLSHEECEEPQPRMPYELRPGKRRVP